MKKAILLFSMLFAINVMATLPLLPPLLYNVENNVVKYNNSEIIGADKESFQVLSYDYAKDKNNVYYRGAIIENADPLTFESLDPYFAYYSQDKQYVYYQGKVVKGADSATFEDLNLELSRDKNNVYYHDKIIENADTTTFEILNVAIKKKSGGEPSIIRVSGYAKDKNNVYYLGNEKSKILKETSEYIIIEAVDETVDCLIKQTSYDLLSRSECKE